MALQPQRRAQTKTKGRAPTLPPSRAICDEDVFESPLTHPARTSDAGGILHLFHLFRQVWAYHPGEDATPPESGWKADGAFCQIELNAI